MSPKRPISLKSSKCHNGFMKVIMKHLLLGSIDQIEKFLNTNKEQGVQLEISSVKDKYDFIRRVIFKFHYVKLDKGDKNIILKYLKYFTHYSKSHLKRCTKKSRDGKLFYNPTRKRNRFSKKYFASDVALLIETDIAHDCLSGEATRRILWREYNKFNKIEYGNISQISSSHIYNLRNKNLQYNSSPAKFLTRTKVIQVNIGTRHKPEPNNKPGYLRVDTVHQGDFIDKKGVYHINIVDEITQYEMIATIEKITEKYLQPIIIELLNLFPFNIYEFHSDNGSEYINKITAKLLNKLHIELTKSRSRHSNDNALVESKNGSVIRKIYGCNYIDQKWAEKINQFNKNYFNIYLNYHRPCGFAINIVDKKGKIKKDYNQWLTPYEKLKSLENAEQYLKPEFSFSELDKTAYEKSDNDFAKEVQKEKIKLFKMIYGR